MPRKPYVALLLIIGCFTANLKIIDPFCIAILLFLAIGFYFGLTAARYLALFLANYATLLALAMISLFGTNLKISIGGYNPNPTFIIITFLIALLIFIYCISGQEIEKHFSKKIIPEKWSFYINIHVIILYLAVALVSITYHQIIETGHQAKNPSTSRTSN